jgi:hypothetical protein
MCSLSLHPYNQREGWIVMRMREGGREGLGLLISLVLGVLFLGLTIMPDTSWLLQQGLGAPRRQQSEPEKDFVDVSASNRHYFT